MDKLKPSSRRRHSLVCAIIFAGLSIFLPALDAITLSQAEATRIGRRIWQNECNGTVSGLTSWNAGEDFASLGIGHFIWYPAGKRGPFDESFPPLIAFMASREAKLPGWLAGGEKTPCPWNSRAEFMRAQQSPEMKSLRQFLAETVDLQTQFLIERLQNALPKMLAAAEKRAHVRQQFERVGASGAGCYALIDYVNFKGEGVLPTERYQGQGWGLLQVLEEMRPTSANAVKEFSRAAADVLTRRVRNSPPARRESRWLPGWINRVNGYSRF